MIEKINRISNPLTIIAIFATLAEIAGTVSLGIVNPSLQSVFVWFVMLFPVLLVTAFFLTLNFNPKVLYAPADFRDDKSFIATVSGAFERPFLKVQRGDVAELPKKLPPSPETDDGQPPEGLERSNAFFGFLMEQLKVDMEKNKLWSISYGVEGEGYFLLHLVLPKEIVAERKSTETSLIIRTQSQEGQTHLKVIGAGIADTDPKRFADKVYDRISKMLASWIDPAKLAIYKPPENGEQANGGD